MESLFGPPTTNGKRGIQADSSSSRRKTFHFAHESQKEVVPTPRKSRASMAPSRSILKQSNEENNTVIGVMQVSVNDDKATTKKFAKRRVSFAPEATLHTFQIDERQLSFPEPSSPARRRESIANGDGDDDTGSQLGLIFSVPSALSNQKSSDKPQPYAPSLQSNGEQSLLSFAKGLFGTQSTKYDEKDTEIESANTSDIFETTRRQMKEHEATKPNQSNSPLFTSTMRNSSFASFFTTKHIESPKADKINNEFEDQYDANDAEKQDQMDLTDFNMFDASPDLLASHGDEEMENMEDAEEEETRDMTQLFGKIKETAEKNSDLSESPMKLSEESASPFRRKTLLGLNAELDQDTTDPAGDRDDEESDAQHDTNTENENENSGNSLEKGEAEANEDMKFTDVPQINSITKDGETMDFTKIDGHSKRGVVEDNQTMDFTTIDKPASPVDGNASPKGNESMDFTHINALRRISAEFRKGSLKRKSILANFLNAESNQDNNDMEFTEISKPVFGLDVQNGNSELGQDESDNEEDDQPENMDFTIVSMNGVSSRNQDDAIKNSETSGNEEEEEMEFTMISKKSSSSRPDENDQDSEEEGEMEFTNVQNLDPTIVNGADRFASPENDQVEDNNVGETSMDITNVFNASMHKPTSPAVSDLQNSKTPPPQKSPSRRISSQREVNHTSSPSFEHRLLHKAPDLGNPTADNFSSHKTPTPQKLMRLPAHVTNSNSNVVDDTPTRQGSSSKRKRLSGIPPNKRRKSQATPPVATSLESSRLTPVATSLESSRLTPVATSLENNRLTPVAQRVGAFEALDVALLDTPSASLRRLGEKVLEFSPKKKKSGESGTDDDYEKEPLRHVLKERDEPIKIKSDFLFKEPAVMFTPLKGQQYTQREDGFGASHGRKEGQVEQPKPHVLPVSSLSSHGAQVQQADETSQIAKFLKNVGIEFVDSLLSNLDIRLGSETRKRMLLNKQDEILSRLGEPRLEDYCMNFEKVPLLEMYKFSTREMHKSIKQSKSLVKEIEQDTNDEAPKLFTEFFASNEEKQIRMIEKFRVMKNHARLLACNTSLKWQQQLIQKVIDELQKSKRAREGDKRMVRARILELGRCVEGGSDVEDKQRELGNVELMKSVETRVKERREEMKKRLQELRAKKEEMERITKARVEELKIRYYKSKEEKRTVELEQEKKEVKRQVVVLRRQMRENSGKKDLQVEKYQKKKRMMESVSGLKILKCLDKLEVLVAGEVVVKIAKAGADEFEIEPQQELVLGVDVKRYLKENSYVIGEGMRERIMYMMLVWSNMKYINYQVNKQSVFSVISVRYDQQKRKVIVGTPDQQMELSVDKFFGVV